MNATPSVRPTRNRVELLREVVCPSCWHHFAPEDVKWVATHPDLVGDSRLGENEAIRFLPTSFNVQANAIDRKGSICNELACPHCHRLLPRASTELPPLMLSIAGTPSCGKSYFLASMAWQLRQNLPSEFSVSITDADPQCNRILNDYEEQQFFNADRDTPVRLRKTEEQGEHYVAVRMGDQIILHPKPFLFGIRPMPGHPNAEQSHQVSRLLCLYDNAGESFLPGRDAVSNPVTRHLGEATALFFCFDPTQDPRMRAQLRGKSNDIQIVEETVTARQEIVFHEMTERYRRLTGTSQTTVTEKPVVIIVTKADSWQSLCPGLKLPRPIKSKPDGSLSAIDMNMVDLIGAQVRKLLFQFTPELVSAAESFSRNVMFIPVSATGRAPEKDPLTGIIGVRPRDVAPVWCDVPLLAVLAKHGAGLIPFVGSSSATINP
ncbi:hypothetical protein [Neorhodopirellula pilleata]|uniref:Uncharacterized protein n=1 Tax=Neorhodopirellula pilleata TaxID=2714738 RepID=A0A5C5ZL42_9BACT|nr:hypothetical protein [Neorhodopirellula pilleata]TWT87846.1 hypothetical protein Pla100_58850 [Neorhodopirellula pilleata]